MKTGSTAIAVNAGFLLLLLFATARAADGCAGSSSVRCANTNATPAQEERQALAPTGVLRVGFALYDPVTIAKDPLSGELKGVAIELGKELARRLGAAFEPIGYTSASAFIDGARTGEWDVAFMAVTPSRAEELADDVTFAAQYMELEIGSVVVGRSPIVSLAQLDQAGNRIAVQQRSQADLALTPVLQRAVLIRSATTADALELLNSGKANAYAANKQLILAVSNGLPGSQIVAPRFFTIGQAIAVPMGRDLAAAYVHRFIEDANSSGLVKASIERAGWRAIVPE